MATQPSGAYGKVYQTTCPDFWKGSEKFPCGQAFRGVLMNEDHKEVWLGDPVGDPLVAFAAMKQEAKKHKITDLRPWSGTLGPVIYQP